MRAATEPVAFAAAAFLARITRTLVASSPDISEHSRLVVRSNTSQRAPSARYIE